LVTFEPFRTGYYISDYDSGDADGEVWGFHVSDDAFHSSWHVEAAYLKSCVAAYKEDGTPGQVNLAPWYYITGVGGWNKSQEDKQIEIIFPGFMRFPLSALIRFFMISKAVRKLWHHGYLRLRFLLPAHHPALFLGINQMKRLRRLKTLLQRTTSA